MMTELSVSLCQALDRDIDDGIMLAAALPESSRGAAVVEAITAANLQTDSYRRLKALHFAQAILADTDAHTLRPRVVSTAVRALRAVAPRLESIHEKRSVSTIAALLVRAAIFVSHASRDYLATLVNGPSHRDQQEPAQALGRG